MDINTVIAVVDVDPDPTIDHSPSAGNGVPWLKFNQVNGTLWGFVNGLWMQLVPQADVDVP